MNLELVGRHALVTGASSGIGRGIAHALAREGARLAIAGRDTGRLEAVATELARYGGERPLCLTADLKVAEECRRLADRVLEAWGRIDILVNCAGGSSPLSGAGPENDATWAQSMALNFDAARYLSEGLIPAMVRASWGRIINITGAVVQAQPNAASPAKAALQSWSRAIAMKHAPDGITVNCVAPGRIFSAQIMERLHPTEESRRDFIARNIPAGRFGEPEEIGDLVAFLASPRASYISGASIPVDGAMVRLAI
jgi:3-oxoacyl-[acyl-carrier protein] reductase